MQPMADSNDLDLLLNDLGQWNNSRKQDIKEKPPRRPDLSGANLQRAHLDGADLRHCNLVAADLRHSHLAHARLSNADLSRAKLHVADLHGASLRKATLVGADLSDANLRHANLSGANVRGATFTGCRIYGTGLWALQGEPRRASDMRVSVSKEDDPSSDKPYLFADSLSSAQFLFLMLDSKQISGAFDDLNRHVVLILGRFSDGHLERLKFMRKQLVSKGHYVPILFDFEKLKRRSLTEAIGAFAHLALFIIADLTDPRSIPQELSHIVPFLPSVPVVPLAPSKKDVYSMFEHFRRYTWVLDLVEYGDEDNLKKIFDKEVVELARKKADELRKDAERWYEESSNG